MNAKHALRQVHHWITPLILLPLGIVVCTGLLLLVKKDFDWIQPPTQKSDRPREVSQLSLEELFAAAKGVPALELGDWASLDRVDVRPDKGIVKFVASNRWEAQIDAHTGEVLQVAYRRSDLIESLHDGSFFADWTKHYVFLPAGVMLLVLWLTGMYLFTITQAARLRKDRRLQTRRRESATPALLERGGHRSK
ncbi:MAG: PepSY-associated TM helix domain-containing protein [Pseudomonadota bacterium]